jgi:hypothetical protein
MTERRVRPESWLIEIRRINSPFNAITELAFGYSRVNSIKIQFLF